MFTLLLVSFGIMTILVYGFRMIGYAAVLPKFIVSSPAAREPVGMKVSLLIPCRNEGANLEVLMSDLSAVDYPAGFYEVIFINDHSEDGSGEILREAASGKLHYHYLELPDTVSGKKQALTLGVQNASGEWIIQVDADCRIPRGLLKEHAYMAAEEDVQLIAGPVIQIPGRGAWENFEALEFMSLSAAGMASFFADRPMMCSGANLSYRRSFYLALKEKLLAVPSASGDDMFLLQEALKRGEGVHYLDSPDAVVLASPTGSLLKFLHQRSRWGSKAKFYSDSEILLVAVIVWMSNMALSAFFIAGLINAVWFLLFIPLWLFKAGADLLLLYRFATLYGYTRLLRWFLPAALFYYFYVGVAGLLSLAGRFRWKGRRYNNQNI